MLSDSLFDIDMKSFNQLSTLDVAGAGHTTEIRTGTTPARWHSHASGETDTQSQNEEILVFS